MRIRVYICACISGGALAHVWIYTHTGARKRTHIHMFTCRHAHARVHLHIYTHIYGHTCTCIYALTHIRVYVYTHIAYSGICSQVRGGMPAQGYARICMFRPMYAWTRNHMYIYAWVRVCARTCPYVRTRAHV